MLVSHVRAGASLALILLIASQASAQYAPRRAAGTATGEDYRFEVGVFVWQPSPFLVVESTALEIPGTPIDIVSDLGADTGNLPEFRFVLRPGRKHKFRVSYVPVTYSADIVLEKTFTFNGTTFRFDLPVSWDFEWKTWRLGYEYDFVYRERGFVGILFEVKYTDVKLDLEALILSESMTVRAPIPAIGGTFRVYPVRNLAIAGEISGIALPGSITEGDDSADYLDWELYATLNFTNNFGVQGGYRSIGVTYRYEQDYGDLEVKGAYIGGVVRF